jgi:phage shock protein A
MPLAVWIALAVFVLATAGGALYVVMRALQAWQTLRSSGRAVEDAANDLLDRVARVEQHVAALEAGDPRVQRSLERLRAATAVLRTELRVISDVRAPLTRFRAAALPRK